MGFPGGAVVKNPPANAGDERDVGPSLGGKTEQKWWREIGDSVRELSRGQSTQSLSQVLHGLSGITLSQRDSHVLNRRTT